MEAKKIIRRIGFIFICAAVIFSAGFYFGSKRRALEYSKRDAEIRTAIEGFAESSYGIGESISNSIGTVELLERIAESERRIRAAELRNREATKDRIDQLENGIIQGQGILSGLTNSIISGQGSISSLSDRIGSAAEKAEEYESLIYSLGIDSNN